MKCLIRTGLAIFVFSQMFPPLFAKEFLTVEKIMEQASKATDIKYPDSDAVLIDDFIQVKYQKDGTSSSWDDTAIKILTEKGKRNNRTISLGFDTAYGTNFFSKVQLIKPDDSVVEINPEANSKVMVDSSQMNANIYNPNSKVLNLSVPGLEVGDTLRYVIHRKTHKAVVPNVWSDYQTFESSMPYQHMTYQVIAPKDRPLVKTALKSEIEGTVKFNELKTEQNDTITYTWEVKDVPRMFAEPGMPKAYTVVQRLLVSTMENWEDLSKWYWQLCKPRLESTTPEMEAKAKELVANAETTQEKVEAVFNFVSQDIRYMGITTEDEAPGYEPHDASITFSNRYGVCRDKAALLAAMLRIVDVEAFPVIIMSGPKKDEEVPQAFFNHAVTAALGDDGNYILMDSTDENTKDIFPTYLQNMSYIVARPEGETLLTSPIIPADENLLKITSSGSLDQSGNLKGKSTLVFEGINDTVYRGYFSKIKPEERRRFFEGHIKNSMPTAAIQTVEILPKELRNTSKPLTVNLTYSAANLLIEGVENKIMVLPKLGSSLGYANFLIGQTGLDERKYPLSTRMTAGIRETLDLKVPNNLGTLSIPNYHPIQSDEMTWNIQVAQNNNSLTSTNSFLMNVVEFSPEQYLKLKNNLKEIEYNLRKKLIIERPKKADQKIASDIQVLDQETLIDLKSTTSWTETSRNKIKILTYAGTKNYSEIKLAYNPAWQHVELTKAVVTHPNGTVQTINKDAINIMDAQWVASAPRYPAERLLVANLPGVEVGSVLDYEFVSTVDGKPFFSTQSSFNAHEPIDQKTLKISAPESMELNILNTGIHGLSVPENGTISYTWSATNQPAVKKEEALPAWWTFNPTVFISTGNWKTYSATILEHLLRASENQPQTEEQAKHLISKADTDRDKVISIRNWVAENIRLAGPGLTQLPLSSLSSADQTLTDRYGNNPDRMIVLYTLLNAAGLNPEFILAGDNLPLITKTAEPLINVPMRSIFGTVLVKVDINKETIYLNGLSQYAALGTSPFDNYQALCLKNGSIKKICVSSDKANRSDTVFDMSVDPTGRIGLTASTLMRGTDFDVFHKKFAEITPENRRRHYLELVSSVSQSAKAVSDLTTDYTKYPGRLEYSIVADRYAVADGEYLYFTIPGGLERLLKYRSNERTLPLAWTDHTDRMIKHNIVLPEGYEPVILPHNFSWQAPDGAGMVEVAVEYSESSNTIRMIHMADLKPALIQPEDFPSIITASQKLAHPEMRTILLKKKK